MRFNISLEKAKQVEIEKQLEAKDISEAIERRQISEANKRRKDLINAQNANKKLHEDVKMKKKLARKEIVKELDNIHTSLISKKL